MNETYISFYLRANRIHIFIDALRGIGCPKFVCFMIDEKGQTLAMIPYPKKDFHSHRVSKSVYNGDKGMEVCSLPLCRLISQLYKWDSNASYRVPGVVISQQKVAMFYLNRAEIIERDDGFTAQNFRK